MTRGLCLVGLLALAACGGGAPVQEEAVVLWRSEVPEVPLTAPPEGSWEPAYQRLRERLAERGGRSEAWVCYGGGGFDEVLAFYAPLYGLAAADVAVEREPAATWFATVARISAELGEPVPATAADAGEELRRAVLGPTPGRPLLVLESPYPDPVSGQPRGGTLACLRAPEESP